jgi:formylglycine-generating enzyme required for sulfatase activity
MPVLGIGSIEISPIDGTILLYVPAGEFTMGNKAEDGLAECQKNRSDCQRDWFTDEEPAHTVYLDAFYMDKYEVSNAAYRECVNRGLCQPPTKVSSSTRSSYYSDSQFDDYPVIYVDWNMAKNYCEWRGARLPTEAEWEKAARGTDGRMYPWGNVFDGSKTNFCDENCSIDWANKNYNDGYADTAPVNAYPDGMSVYGIFNLAGNVWEWVADWYDATYYARSPSSNPQGPFSGDGRALRGGSWYVTGDSVRASNRRGNDVPSTSVDFFGFRCARSLP